MAEHLLLQSQSLEPEYLDIPLVFLTSVNRTSNEPSNLTWMKSLPVLAGITVALQFVMSHEYSSFQVST